MTTVTEAYRARLASDCLTADPAQEALLPLLDRVADELGGRESAKASGFQLFRRRKEAARGLYIWGGVGRGKSMLMDMFFDTIGIAGKRRAHFHAFMQDIHARLHAVRLTGATDAISPVADQVSEGLSLLCFDEMQIGDITDAMIVGRLFERFFRNGVTVVTTSNRVPDDLYKDGLQRERFLPFIALIKEKLDIHHLESETDWRQNRLAGERRYFSPVDSEALSAMDAIWSDFGGDSAEPLDLVVKGRTVTLPAFARGVARASFWDLCGKPLGPGDYLAIAESVRMLMLDRIPCLSRANFNEAKRFVTLIDALYEARVGLIASAEAVPERLYIEGEGAFEFERTASRLVEMQSDGWAAD